MLTVLHLSVYRYSGIHPATYEEWGYSANFMIKIAIASGRIAYDAQKKYVMLCMTRISQQECRGILEGKRQPI